MDSVKRAKSKYLPALGSRAVPGGPDSGVEPATIDPTRPYPVRPVRAWAQIATRAGVWSAIGIGCIGAIVGLLRPTSPASPAAAESPESETVPATVANFAELAVETWLTATGDDHAQLDVLFAEPLDFQGLGDVRRTVTRVATIGGSRLQDGYWKVTVAADIVEPGAVEPDERSGQDAPAGPAEQAPARWYVEIGIVGDAKGGLIAVDAPALMPSRSVDTSGLRLVGPEMEGMLDDDPVAGTLQGFFDAFLTGQGDLSRYLAEGVRGGPVTPAPFTTATVERLSVESLGENELLVRAEVRATTPGGAQQLLSYELHVQLSSSGRWEISHAAGAPTLVRDAKPVPPSSSATEPSDEGEDTDPPRQSTPTSVTPTSFATEPGM